MPRDSEWFKTPAGDDCPWCKDGEASEHDPFDADDAHATLCRGHEAEWHGASLEGLDRMEEGIRADMAELGYFD